MAATYRTFEETKELAEKCAAILACITHGRGECALEMELFGLKQDGIVLGDWRVIIECINYPGHDC